MLLHILYYSSIFFSFSCVGFCSNMASRHSLPGTFMNHNGIEQRSCLWICRWLNGDAYTFCSFPHNSPVWQPEPNHTQCLLTSGTFLEEKWNYFEGFTFINLVIYRTMWNMRHLHRRRQRPGVSSVEHWNLFLTSVISVIFGRRCSLPTVDINVKCALYT